MGMGAENRKSRRNSVARMRPKLETLEVRRLLTIWADFNNDGFSDLAVGVGAEDVGSVVDAGAVNVIYGTANGLARGGNQIWHLDSPGLLGVPNENDGFGAALAAGDFDGDGFDDLAIGAPYVGINGQSVAGAVWTLYGSAAGLTSTGSERLHQDNSRVRDVAEVLDQFGSTLVSADFDNDGYDDLAVGIPGEAVFEVEQAGAVHVFYGNGGGLSARRNRMFHQDSGGVAGAAEAYDHFGAALAAGDTNGDGYAELFVGVPEEDVGGVNNVGGMQVLHGSASGLRRIGNQTWIHTGAEVNDQFAFSIASGDFNDDGYDDVAVGVPGKNIGAALGAGMVTTWYGSAGGLTNEVYENWTQDEIGGSSPEFNDQFGFVLAVGDFVAGGDDLIIGTPFEDIGAIPDAGSVSVLYGPFGFAGSDYFTQGASIGNLAASEPDDWFGYSLANGDFDGDGLGDLAIGIPFKDIGPIVNAGAVSVLFGAIGDNLPPDGAQLWHQDSAGIEGVAEPGDVFGGTAAAGSKSNPGGGGSYERHLAIPVAPAQSPEPSVTQNPSREMRTRRRRPSRN